jgi:hypothetical protein
MTFLIFLYYALPIICIASALYIIWQSLIYFKELK